MNSRRADTPRVSVILPTYNRAGFLQRAFDSISAQTFTDWELVIVDDGSTDDTSDLVATLSASITAPVRYVRQENQGAYGARNTGLDLAKGDYVAFFDSDDRWLPHHLHDCVAALDANPEVDWVYGACVRVEFATGRVLQQSSFHIASGPRPFLDLTTRKSGELRIIEDPKVLQCQLLHGLFCGLQNSVIRRRVFANRRFWPQYRVVEDELFVIRLLAAGVRFGYFENIHVVYHVHGENSSAAAAGASHDKTLRVLRELVDGFEQLRSELTLRGADARALAKRLSREYFWHLGYHGFWLQGQRRDALTAFGKGLRVWPWDVRCWKTFTLSLAKTALGTSSH
jgi:cellulose synthase/poly-beta-1,6-N-acetylglucosamine synthase-like glycosyltransferase